MSLNFAVLGILGARCGLGIRSAKVKVAGKGDRKPQVLRRVIQDLIPVEVSE